MSSGTELTLRRDGHVVLITGGASGLGLEIADIFGRAGYGLILVDVDEEAGRQQAARFESDGVEAIFIAGDVSDEGQVLAAFEAALERFGRLDVVINNAGISGPEAYVQDLELPDFEHVMRVDLGGPFLVCREAVRTMRLRGGGAIVNIASIAAQVSTPAYPAYGAAKAGVISLTRSMAKHIGRFNIRINCISPGSIKGTRFMDSARDGRPATPEETRDLTIALIQKVPLGRPAKTEDIAHAALFLASPLARHIHGTVLTVDGGESLA